MFITGFPDDVRERELNNMLRFLPGYEVRGPAARGQRSGARAARRVGARVLSRPAWQHSSSAAC